MRAKLINESNFPLVGKKEDEIKKIIAEENIKKLGKTFINVCFNHNLDLILLLFNKTNNNAKEWGLIKLMSTDENEDSFKILQFLINKNIDINAKNSYPLRVACVFNKKHFVKILLDAGADVHIQNINENLKTHDGKIDHFNRENRHLLINVIKGLKSYDSRFRKNENPNIVKDIVKMLLNKGCDEYLNEALMTAILYCKEYFNLVETIKILIDAGADVNYRNGAPLKQANWFKNGGLSNTNNSTMDNVISILKKHGAIHEGVADTYAEKFGIQNTYKHDDERSAAYSVKDEEKILAPKINGVYPENYKVIVNPSSIDSIPYNARGLIDSLGNLYFNIGYVVTHSVLINFLEEMDILEHDAQWNAHLPKDFLTVQRRRDTNIIAIGESNLFAYPIGTNYYNNAQKFRAFTEKDKNKTIEYFFKKAKKKNPYFVFVNKIIGYL